MKFSEICTFAVIYAAYLAARRGKRSRAATAHYEVRLLENIVNLVYILKTKIYRPGVFRVFYVYEPKKRLVQAPAFVDKVVQHAIVDNLLYDRITRSFILDNYAYASYVEYGHRTTKGGWVPGHYFLTLSEQDLESLAPAAIERKLELQLRQVFNV